MVMQFSNAFKNTICYVTQLTNGANGSSIHPFTACTNGHVRSVEVYRAG